MKDAFGSDCTKALQHYNTLGKKIENRNAKCGTTQTISSPPTTNSGDFNCQCYLNRYSDLKAAFGSDCTKALQHYNTFGKNENRNAKCGTTQTTSTDGDDGSEGGDDDSEGGDDGSEVGDDGTYQLRKKNNDAKVRVELSEKCHMPSKGSQYSSGNSSSYFIGNGFNGTLEECKQKCNTYPECVGFNRRRKGVDKDATCYFLNKRDCKLTKRSAYNTYQK